MTARLGTALGLSSSEVGDLRRTALLHDIGKLAVPNRILDMPGQLSPAEWDVVRAHPRYTFEILDRVPRLREMAFDASLHHERLDGRGYYRGVSGDALPLSARIMAVADVYDALLADRPYRAGLPFEQVLALIRQDAGTALCHDCVCALETVARPADAQADAA